MLALRRALLRFRVAAMLAIALALALRLLVPAGMMVDSAAGSLTVRICADGSHDAGATMTIAVARDRSAGGHALPDAAKSGGCAFGGLAMAGLPTVDPLLLAVALAFVLALGFARVLPLPAPAPRHVRPPLRGPPAAG